MTDITELRNVNKQALDDALDFDLFEGDFGTPDDTELSNKSLQAARNTNAMFVLARLQKVKCIAARPGNLTAS
ncbi:hypothetical protein NUKP24_20970 [Klebsiella variicola]|uniref:hypothetical protein n=1 Tax=Klebsiella variicola TaxID=244366 RepID=UPI0021819AC3|nr:hypothetical protein [Klebsiella variicola]GKJ27939.1 hypothetical protein NUKP24_20970 [Klebsiella variicola]HCI9143664.1 hypothetical protein [Klebsiella variicola]